MSVRFQPVFNNERISSCAQPPLPLACLPYVCIALALPPIAASIPAQTTPQTTTATPPCKPKLARLSNASQHSKTASNAVHKQHLHPRWWLACPHPLRPPAANRYLIWTAATPPLATKAMSKSMHWPADLARAKWPVAVPHGIFMCRLPPQLAMARAAKY